jgi:hypothetical protein
MNTQHLVNQIQELVFGVNSLRANSQPNASPCLPVKHAWFVAHTFGCGSRRKAFAEGV